MITTVVMLINIKNIPNRRHLNFLKNIFILQIIFILTSVLVNGISTNIYYIPSDLLEISRPTYNLLIVVLLSIIFKEGFNFNKSNKIIVSIIVILNAIICIEPHLFSNNLNSLVELYGSGSVYTYGYSKFRAFGITGQPGKNGIFSSLLVILIFLIFNNKKEIKIKWLFIILTTMSILFTYSRISLILYILLLIIYLYTQFNIGKKIYFLIILVLLAITLNKLDIIDYEIIFRGLDSGSLGTLGHRNHLRKWAFETIISSPIHFMFGIGPCKEYISQFTTSYASDLTLRNPDSSFTLWMLRYGFLGLIIFYTPYLYLLNVIKRTKLGSLALYLLIISLFISFFDPIFHEPKIQLLFWLIIFYILYLKNGKKHITNYR